MPADEPQAPPPLIVISYSKEEEKWKDQLVSLFPTDVDFRLMLNRVEEFPGRLDEETAATLPDAKVVVLLLSPSYLSNSWITGDRGDVLGSLESERGVRTLPVLVRYCSWEEVPYFRNRNEPLMIDVKPLAEGTPEEQNLTLQRIATRILRLAGLSGPEQGTSANVSPNNTVFGERVRLLRFNHSLTQAQLGRRVGLTQGEVSRIEKGQVTPNLETVEKLAKVFETTADALIRGTSEEQRDWPPKELEKFKWNKEVDRALVQAQLLARSTAVEGPISPTCLLFALAEEFLPERKSSISEFLLIELAKRDMDRYNKALRETFPNYSRPRSTIPVPVVSASTLGILELAETYSMRTIRLDPPPGTNVRGPLSDGTIASRHLVAALLKTWHQEPWLTGTRELVSDIDLAALCERFFDFVLNRFPKDDPLAWRDILTVKIDPDQYRVSGEDQPKGDDDVKKGSDQETDTEGELERKPVLAGFATDYWIGRDLLNIEEDVNALASLVSAWSVEPPLSIGLFGEWGSGKSHFMRQMRTQVEKLSRKARKSEKRQNEIGYYKNIVQIEFNAWHYIEGNLWASLVDHIFANLRISEKEKLSIVHARRDELMNKLGVKKEIESKLKSKIQEKKGQLETKKKEATDLASKAEKKKEQVSTQLAGFRSEAEKQLDQIEVPVHLDEKDKAVLKRIGLEPENWRTGADFRRHYDEAKGFSNRIRAQWKLFVTDRVARRRLFLAAGVTLIPLVALLLPQLSKQVKIPAGVLTAVGVIVAVLSAAKPVWKQFHAALSALEEHDAAVERERQKRIGDLQAEVTALTKTVLDAETEAASLKTEIEDLDLEIKNTSTSKILAEFIEDRAAASDYRRHLGLLALIRRDFEKLRELFDQQRKEEKAGNETHDANRINRIILYIDDLDRCPPQRVVEVLQAIHLLLAFPIFVVVVGVDARWVTRSLQESYEWLRLEEDDRKKKDEADDDDEEDRDGQGATPHDYLEKIFQIPFWLRPMEETQCKSFIEGLTEQIRYRAPQQAAPDSNGDKNPAVDSALKRDDVKDLTPAHSTSGNGGPAQTDISPTAEMSVASDMPQSETGEGTDSDSILDAAVIADELQSNPAFQEEKDLSSEEQAEEKDSSSEEQAEEKETEDDIEKQSDEENEIDLDPVSLTLGDAEIDYMTSLAKLIGRSPRAVKRFLNCYRLIKVSLPPAELQAFVDDGESYKFKAVMILLGIITGAPTVSLYVVEVVENWRPDENAVMADFTARLEENADLLRQPDWLRLKTFLDELTGTDESAEMLTALIEVTPRVSRYSFRVARAEAAGPRRAKPKPNATAPKTLRQPTA